MTLFYRLLAASSWLNVLSAQEVMRSCRPTCVAFRLDRSALNCHRSGAFASKPSPWDLDAFDASPCFNTTTIFDRGARALPENLTIWIHESGKTDAVISSRFDLYGTDVVTHCSDYTCPDTECTTTAQMGSMLVITFFPLGLTDTPIASFKLGLTLDFADGDPIGSFGSTRFGPLVPLWMDDPSRCRTHTSTPSLVPPFIPTSAPSSTAPIPVPSYAPSVIKSELRTIIPSIEPSLISPSNVPTEPSAANPTKTPSTVPSSVPSFDESSIVPSSVPTFFSSEQTSAPLSTLFPSGSPSMEPTWTPSRFSSKHPSVQPSYVPSTARPTERTSNLPSFSSSVQPKSAEPSISTAGEFPISRSMAPTPFPTISKLLVGGLEGNAPTEKREPHRGKSIIIFVVGVVAFLASVAAIMKHVVNRHRERDFAARFGSDDSQGADDEDEYIRREIARLTSAHSCLDASESSASSRSRRIGIIPVHSLSTQNHAGTCSEKSPSSVVADDNATPGPDSQAKDGGDLLVSTRSSLFPSSGDEYSFSARSALNINGVLFQDLSSIHLGTGSNSTTSYPDSVLGCQLASLAQLSAKPLFPSQSARISQQSARLPPQDPLTLTDEHNAETFPASHYPDLLTIAGSFNSNDMSGAQDMPRRMTWSQFLNPLMETRPFDEDNAEDIPEDMGVYGSLLDQNCGPDSYSDTSLSYDSRSAIFAAESSDKNVFDDVDLRSDDDDNRYTSPFKDEDLSTYGYEQEAELTMRHQGKYTAANLRRWLFPNMNKKPWLPVHSHYHGKE